jgi:hypothetical protein
MRGAVPPLPSTPSWRGAQLKKHRETLFLILKTKLNYSHASSLLAPNILLDILLSKTLVYVLF